MNPKYTVTEAGSTQATPSVTRLSPCHFARAFKRTFGLSVHLYLIRRRIVLAQQLLVNTYDPLGEIALICGMHDQPHFTRWFRRLVGETPNRWRHAHRTIPFSTDYKDQLMEES